MKDLFSVKGKTVVVTGGGRGIGAMIAEGFVSAGAKTYIAARKAETLDETAKALSGQGEIIPISADLSTEAGCRGLVDELAKREQRLDVLINNAGATWGAPLEEYPDSAFDRCWDLNVRGVFHLTRFLLPLLKNAASADAPARVINIGSIDGIRVPAVENYAYAASKAAVHQLTRVLSRKLASSHITVNAIAPGPFDTKMMHETIERIGPAIRAGCPLGRIGEPEDLAGTAIFLASRAGAYITGAVIPVDGGISTDHE
jgi:NAD(P)-dependent dehydrogenase (short-subunit alcohol dehydrogenase family)